MKLKKYTPGTRYRHPNRIEHEAYHIWILFLADLSAASLCTIRKERT